MAPTDTIEIPSTAGAPADAPSAFVIALTRLEAAERQIAAARRDARSAGERLALAQQQLDYARHELRAGRVRPVVGEGAVELIGMGFFPDEIGFGD
jgi:hypothetical protein